jgi:hypothetical protein
MTAEIDITISDEDLRAMQEAWDRKLLQLKQSICFGLDKSTTRLPSVPLADTSWTCCSVNAKMQGRRYRRCLKTPPTSAGILLLALGRFQETRRGT